jgi:micrococcal nuclease
MMQNYACESLILKTHFNVVKVVDGDGLIIENLFNKEQEEVRLLGIDAPEIKRCKKLLQDERETHLPGELLIELGYRSMNRLVELAPIGVNISLLSPVKNQYDVYGRTLAYVFTNDGLCLNELMVSEGFAKPYSRYYCTKQYLYQSLSSGAKTAKIGLFSLMENF